MASLTCKYCGRKFHKGKTNAFGRMSRHIWKDHAEAHRRSIKRGQKKQKSQLQQEMEYTDDMIVQALQDAGIPISPVRQQQQMYTPQQSMYAPIPGMGQPVQHEIAVGAIISAFKLGMQIYAAGKTIAKARSKFIKKRPTGKGTKYKGGMGKKVKPR